MVFHYAISKAKVAEDVKERVNNLIDSITYSVFMYTSRGLFERDKLTFISQVAFQVQLCVCDVYINACIILYVCTMSTQYVRTCTGALEQQAD